MRTRRVCFRLKSENHTLKRALTDPRLFAGIGNAYSDEILHHAKLSPIALTKDLAPEEVERLFHSTKAVLTDWIKRLRSEGIPEKVTAFREEMAVHGRYGKPCPVCGAPVQRIVYAENETNYCARCQTGGRILGRPARSPACSRRAGRALSTSCRNYADLRCCWCCCSGLGDAWRMAAAAFEATPWAVLFTSFHQLCACCTWDW
jgi:ribosomal protein S13